MVGFYALYISLSENVIFKRTYKNKNLISYLQFTINKYVCSAMITL